jgi:glycosyltransferase involved in cell wall biosynthesis
MIAWGYNEQLLIEGFLRRALSLLEHTCREYELVFIDDCSTDRTGEIAEAVARDAPRLRIIRNERNLGMGGAANVAVHAAQNEHVFWQTVDWAYDLSELRCFLELTKRFDLVIGTRPVIWRPFGHIPLLSRIVGIRARADTVLHGAVSLTNYYVLRLLFGVRIHDFQNVQIYPRRFIEQLQIKASSSFIAPEMLYKCYLLGATFMEVPVRFIPRSVGKSRGIRPRSILRSLRDIACGWLEFGPSVRRAVRASTETRIFRLTQPTRLSEDDIRLMAGLFRYYRAVDDISFRP